MSRCSVRKLALRSSRSRLNRRVGRHAHIFWWVFEHTSVRRRLFLCMATSFPAQRKKPRVRRPHGGSAIIEGVLGAHLPALRRACGATAAQCSGDAATAARPASVFFYFSERSVSSSASLRLPAAFAMASAEVHRVATLMCFQGVPEYLCIRSVRELRSSPPPSWCSTRQSERIFSLFFRESFPYLV